MQAEGFFDTHCHFDYQCFDSERVGIWQRCGQQGVTELLIPGVVAEDWRRIRQLCQGNAGWYFALGLHPCFMAQHRNEHLGQLSKLIKESGAIAVGEIGLDFWHGVDGVDEQLGLFSAQLVIAKEVDLPVLLHVRKAHDQVLKQLRLFKLPRGGIVHAFSASQQQAEQYLQLGFKLGIGGALTYPRAQRLRKQVAELPLEALVLETDAPDMPLHGWQGQDNSPERIPLVFKELVSLREESEQVIKTQLYRNSRQILGLGVYED